MRRAVSFVLLHAARLPCRCRTVPSTIDIHIDAGTNQSVIRTTLLRYTLKSLPVNILVCGKLSKVVEDLAPFRPFNTTPDKGFSSARSGFCLFRAGTFHSPAFRCRRHHPFELAHPSIPYAPSEIHRQDQIDGQDPHFTPTRVAGQLIDFQREERTSEDHREPHRPHFQ